MAAALALTAVFVGPGRDWPNAAFVLPAVLPAWVLLNKLLGLYDRDANLVHKSTLDELPRVAQSTLYGAMLLFLAAPPALGWQIERLDLIVFCLSAVVLVPCARSLTRNVICARFEPERALIVGSGVVARLVARKLRAHPEYGVNVVGFVDIAGANPDAGDDCELFEDLEAFADVCRDVGAERVVIAFSNMSHVHMLEAVRASKMLGLKITVVPRLFEVIGGSVEIDQVEGMTMLGLRGLGRTRSSLLLKRTVDVVLTAFGLLFLAPLLLAVAIAIKLDSRGPLVFGQWRIGRQAKPFRIFKFRTMVDGAESMKDGLAHLNEAAAPMFKITDDPRLTRVGRFLRRSSLDELPQLINVLLGQMSLVGPRPLVPEEDAHVIGWHRARLDLTPGLTGPWQVLGRTRIPFDEMVKIDYLYVNDWTLWNDLKLLLRTGPVVLRRSGA